MTIDKLARFFKGVAIAMMVVLMLCVAIASPGSPCPAQPAHNSGARYQVSTQLAKNRDLLTL